MKAFSGIGIVIGCVAGGYSLAGGHFHVLWQPAELLIIWGAAIGAFIIANPPSVLSRVGQALGEVFKTKSFSKEDYRDILCLQFILFKTARTKGLLALESHIEQPLESPIFKKFPRFLENKEAVIFLCDYLRLFTMGSENVYQIDDLMSEEIDVYEHEKSKVSHAFTGMADGMPALGIVAAVLGVIHTMGSINEPPEILGQLIGAALVGTFAGVLFAYGFIGPIASSMQVIANEKVKFFQCIKSGLIAYLQGHPPMVTIDYARKSIDGHKRPSFLQMEEFVKNIENIF